MGLNLIQVDRNMSGGWHQFRELWKWLAMKWNWNFNVSHRCCVYCCFNCNKVIKYTKLQSITSTVNMRRHFCCTVDKTLTQSVKILNIGHGVYLCATLNMPLVIKHDNDVELTQSFYDQISKCEKGLILIMILYIFCCTWCNKGRFELLFKTYFCWQSNWSVTIVYKKGNLLFNDGLANSLLCVE